MITSSRYACRQSIVQTSYQCPSCQIGLTNRRHAPGMSWLCNACGGAAMTMSVIRQHAHAKLSKAIWAQLSASQAPSARRCPACSGPFKTFVVDDANGGTELDGCARCQFFWFDHTELERMGVVTKELPPVEVRRAIADLQIEAIRERQEEVELAETVQDLVRWWYRWP